MNPSLCCVFVVVVAAVVPLLLGWAGSQIRERSRGRGDAGYASYAPRREEFRGFMSCSGSLRKLRSRDVLFVSLSLGLDSV